MDDSKQFGVQISRPEGDNYLGNQEAGSACFTRWISLEMNPDSESRWGLCNILSEIRMARTYFLAGKRQ